MPRNGFFSSKSQISHCTRKWTVHMFTKNPYSCQYFFLFDMEGIFTVYFSSSRFSYCSLVWLPAVKQCHVDTMMKPSLEEPNWFDTLGPLAGDLLQ